MGCLCGQNDLTCLDTTVPGGPTGPQGPTGNAGTAGPAGPQGPTGADGADGQDGANILELGIGEFLMANDTKQVPLANGTGNAFAIDWSTITSVDAMSQQDDVLRVKVGWVFDNAGNSCQELKAYVYAVEDLPSTTEVLIAQWDMQCLQTTRNYCNLDIELYKRGTGQTTGALIHGYRNSSTSGGAGSINITDDILYRQSHGDALVSIDWPVTHKIKVYFETSSTAFGNLKGKLLYAEHIKRAQ